MRRILFSLIALALLVGLAGCSTAEADSVKVGPDAIVLDVRTPQEFAAGHLEGAELLDFNSGDFAAEIPDLEPGDEYFVYCRSGNRSGQAVALLEDAGFDNVTDLGALDSAASATGISIVN